MSSSSCIVGSSTASTGPPIMSLSSAESSICGGLGSLGFFFVEAAIT